MSSPSYRAGIQLDRFLNVPVPVDSWPDSGLMESRLVQDFNLCDEVTFGRAAYVWDLSIDFCITTGRYYNPF